MKYFRVNTFEECTFHCMMHSMLKKFPLILSIIIYISMDQACRIIDHVEWFVYSYWVVRLLLELWHQIKLLYNKTGLNNKKTKMFCNFFPFMVYFSSKHFRFYGIKNLGFLLPFFKICLKHFCAIQSNFYT